MTNYDSNYQFMNDFISGLKEDFRRMTNKRLCEESLKAHGMTDSELMMESCLSDFILCYNDFIREECFIRFLDYASQFPDDNRV